MRSCGARICATCRSPPARSMACSAWPGRIICRNQPAFYREVWRLLKPGGRFVLADVREGSRVAAFLNEWLHAHNSLGHRGLFLGASTLPQLARCSFTDLVSAPRSYPWVFASPEAMASYCRSLFGADLADDAAILEGLRGGPGWDEEGGCCHPAVGAAVHLRPQAARSPLRPHACSRRKKRRPLAGARSAKPGWRATVSRSARKRGRRAATAGVYRRGSKESPASSSPSRSMIVSVRP